MTQALKKEVTVLPGGRIELSSPQLKPGTQAEVIIIFSEAEKNNRPLSSFFKRGSGLFKSAEDVDTFLRQERDAWD